MTKSTVIDLDALTAPDRLPKVKLFGRELVVYPLTGALAHKIATVQDTLGDDASGGKLLGELLEVLGGCVPDLTPDERQRLTVDQIAALLQLSRGQIAEVEAMIEQQAAGDAAEAKGGAGGAEGKA